jgi:hypothetical protein
MGPTLLSVLPLLYLLSEQLDFFATKQRPNPLSNEPVIAIFNIRF